MQGLIAAVIILAAAIALIAGFISLYALGDRRRSTALRGLAESMGAVFTQRVRHPPDARISACRLFQRGADGEITNLIALPGASILICDFEDLVGSEHGARRARQTVVSLRRPNFGGPAFAVRPLSVRDAQVSAMIVPFSVFDDMTGDHDPAARTDPEQPTLTLDDDAFDQRFRVYAANPAVRDILRRGLRDELMRLQETCFDAAPGWVLIYRDDLRITPDNIRPFIEVAQKLADHV